MVGGGGECKYHAHFAFRAARDRDWYFEKKKLSNKAWLIYRNGHWIWTGVSNDKELTLLFYR